MIYFNSTKKAASVKSVQIVHLAMCAGVLLFLIVCLFLNKEDMNFDLGSKEVQLHLFIGVFALIAGILLSIFIMDKKLRNVAAELAVEEKFAKYVEAFITSIAIVEGAALLNTVFFLLHANGLFVINAILLLVYMAGFRPTRKKIAQQLKLSWDEDLV